jgi:hypothetical protein
MEKVNSSKVGDGKEFRGVSRGNCGLLEIRGGIKRVCQDNQLNKESLEDLDQKIKEIIRKVEVEINDCIVKYVI